MTFVPAQDSWESIFIQFRDEKTKMLERRQNLLEDLIGKGLDLLAIGDSPLLAYQFRNIEVEITWMDFDVELTPSAHCIAINEAKENLRDAIRSRQRQHLKTLRSSVRKLVRKILSTIAIDRRAQFRSIVHLIFKNMDDYDGKKYALRLS